MAFDNWTPSNAFVMDAFVFSVTGRDVGRRSLEKLELTEYLC